MLPPLGLQKTFLTIVEDPAISSEGQVVRSLGKRLRPVLGSWRQNPALATQAAWRQGVPRNLGGLGQFHGQFLQDWHIYMHYHAFTF